MSDDTSFGSLIDIIVIGALLLTLVGALGTYIIAGSQSRNATGGNVTGSGKTTKMYVSSYGYNDNSPPSAQIAFPKSAGNSSVHTKATEGSGMYNDPITFATSTKELKPGTRVYVQSLQKYFVMEDICGACNSDWSNGKYHIDLWIGPQHASDSNALYQCEDHITRDPTEVIIDPPGNLVVDTTPLFQNNTCTAHIH
jgi:3D (Asp-Asp-Asp) domain-containing protein